MEKKISWFIFFFFIYLLFLKNFYVLKKLKERIKMVNQERNKIIK